MRPREGLKLSVLPIVVFERNQGGGSRVHGNVVIE